MDLPSSFQIGRVRGIPIRLHLTFLLVLPFFAFFMGQAYFAPEGQTVTGLGLVWGALLAIVLFACVTLHELSHSVTAQGYGIRVRSITLLPIGGVSQMEELPKEPRKELLISAAGPLTNFVIAAPLLALSAGGLVPAVAPQFGDFVRWAGLLNLLLGAFNLLLPAFPMDGGRILRAALAARMNFAKATRYAASVGRALAFAMGIVGFFTLTAGGIWLLLIAFFIYMGASEEERVVNVMQTLGTLRVRDVMTSEPATLAADASLEEAFRAMVETKHVGFPVVDEAGSVAGFLGLPELGKVDRGLYGTTRVREAMRPAPSIHPDALATEALRQMSLNNEEHLVAIEDGRLAGILTKTDVSRIVRILAVERGSDLGELGV